ncbi:MAG TPA: RDD family protein [Candidatus Dormibacteraeota bacterium]|nr:RDD family protein [Candidatus Dormibacteraeota bacterium]
MSGGIPDMLRVSTSDNVGIGYDVAGLGSRFIAQILDTLIVGVVILAVSIGLVGAIGVDNSQNQLVGILAVAGVDLVIYVGYFTLCEMLSGGRTPGKSAGHLQVLDISGAAPTLGQLFVRNVARLVDVLLGVGVVVMFCSRHSRRLGDFLAGTVVVRVRPVVSFAAPIAPPPVLLRTPDAGPAIDGVNNLGERELAAIRTLLSRPGLAPPLRARLAEDMTTRLLDRMGVPASAPERQWPPELFLERLYLQLQGRTGR